jgi:hypothetical protein
MTALYLITGMFLGVLFLVLGMVLASRMRSGQSVLPSLSLRPLRTPEKQPDTQARRLPATGA